MYKSLSIIIPAYNEEIHIKACLESVAAQTVSPDEVIVVDNGSSDSTARLARRFKFVKVIYESERGIAPARDAGFNAAKSDYLGRIDADTILPDDWVKRVKEFYANDGNKDAALTGGAVFRNIPHPQLASWLQAQLAFRMSRLALGHHILWGSNMVVPRHAWQKTRGSVCHSPVMHEDIDLAIHLHNKGFNIRYDPKLKVNAYLKRVYSGQDRLWFNLKWWPRTLKRHNKIGWPITLLAAACVYMLAVFARIFPQVKPAHKPLKTSSFKK